MQERQKNNRPQRLWIIVLFALATVLLSGCDNSVSILDRDLGVYSVYGSLNIHENVNYIRIKDLNARLVKDSTRSIDATVTLKNLQKGTSEVLKDTVVQFDNLYTHNFRSTMEITPATTYRVTIEHPNKETVRATATTPRIADTSVEPKHADCETPITVTFAPVRDPNDLDVAIGIQRSGGMRWVFSFHASPSTDASDDTVHLSFTPLNVLDAIFKLNPNRADHPVWCHELDSDEITIRYTHYGPDFFGNTPSDSLNVPGGIGRFGGMYDDSFSFPIDTTNICAPFC